MRLRPFRERLPPPSVFALVHDRDFGRGKNALELEFHELARTLPNGPAPIDTTTAHGYPFGHIDHVRSQKGLL